MKVKLILTFITLFVVSCSSSPQYTVLKLPSGKEIKILGISKLYSKNDGNPPALALKYQTDIDIDDLNLLRKEAEEIWPVFRVDVEKARLSNAVLMATSPPFTQFLFFSRTRGYGFTASQRENGTWNLNSWKRDYDKEAQIIAENYLESFKEQGAIKTAQLFHYPDHFDSEEINREIDGIAGALTVISENLGAIDSYQLNNSPISYEFLALHSASAEYLNTYPYFSALIYDVEYSEKGKGYLLFKFWIVKDKLVINSVLYALPADDPETKIVFKALTELLENTMGDVVR